MDFVYRIKSNKLVFFVAITLLILSFVLVWRTLLDLFLENIFLISIMLPFLITLLIFCFLYKDKFAEILTIGTMLIGFMAIIFPVVLGNSNTQNLLISQSVFNCMLSRQLQNTQVVSSNFFADLASPEWKRFLLDGYLNNASLIANKFGSDITTMIPGTIYSMDVANRLLDEVRNYQKNSQEVPHAISVNLSNIGNDIVQIMCKIANIYDKNFDASRPRIFY